MPHKEENQKRIEAQLICPFPKEKVTEKKSDEMEEVLSKIHCIPGTISQGVISFFQ